MRGLPQAVHERAEYAPAHEHAYAGPAAALHVLRVGARLHPRHAPRAPRAQLPRGRVPRASSARARRAG